MWAQAKKLGRVGRCCSGPGKTGQKEQAQAEVDKVIKESASKVYDESLPGMQEYTARGGGGEGRGKELPPRACIQGSFGLTPCADSTPPP